jgi:lipopolysaccharide biosynthesis glycosyltransferase
MISKRPPLNIAISFDKNYVGAFFVLLLSILINNKKSKVNVYTIAPEISGPEKTTIQKLAQRYNAKVIFYDLDRTLVSNFSLNTFMHFTDAIFYKLYFPLVVPGTVKRLLYLDTDTLVLVDLHELFASKMNAPLGAVSDTGMHVRNDLGINSEENYFNAGVLLIDVPAWLSQDVTSRALEFIQQRDNTSIFGEQDALNYIFRNNWHKIQSKFNFKPLVDIPDLPSRLQRSLIEKQAIIHYVGFFKPWTVFNSPAKYLYERYQSKLAKTPEGKLISDSRLQTDLTRCITLYVRTVEDNVRLALIIAFQLNLLWIRSIEAYASAAIRSSLLSYYDIKPGQIRDTHLTEITATFEKNRSVLENMINATSVVPTTNAPTWEKRWRKLCEGEIGSINKKPKGKDLFTIPRLIKNKMMINAKKEELLLFALNHVSSMPTTSAYSDRASS